MAEKSPDEVPEAVRLKMFEVVGRVRSAPVMKLLWEDRLTDSERQRLEVSISDDQRKKLGTIGIWRELYGGSEARAVLEIAERCDLLTPEECKSLSGKIGVEEENLPVEVQKALDSAQLVLIDPPPSAYWGGKEIVCNWEGQNVVWQYFFKLAKAARHQGSISVQDFGDSSMKKNLTDWKCRLLKNEDLFGKIGDLIESKQGKHRLKLPREKIRIFVRVSEEGLQEVHH